IPEPLSTGAEGGIVMARLRQGQVGVRAADPVEVIAIVLPETHRAHIIGPAFGQGALPATRTGEPPFPTSVGTTHPAMVASRAGNDSAAIELHHADQAHHEPTGLWGT